MRAVILAACSVSVEDGRTVFSLCSHTFDKILRAIKRAVLRAEFGGLRGMKSLRLTSRSNQCHGKYYNKSYYRFNRPSMSCIVSGAFPMLPGTADHCVLK